MEIKHINLKISNLKKTILYYTDILGFRVTIKHPKEATLYIEDGKPLITLHEIEGALPKSNTTGLYHFAMLLPTRSDLGSLLRRFIQKGYQIDGASDHLVSEALYMHDPDGNGIEIYVDKPRSSWKFENNQVVMDTLPFPFEEILSSTPDITMEQLPTRTKIGHIHLHVNHLVEATTYYTTQLKLDLMLDYHSARFLSYDGYHHHIGINIWNGSNASLPKPNQVGLDHVTIEVKNESLYLSIKEALEQTNNIEIQSNNMFVTKDPSGNTFQFVRK